MTYTGVDAGFLAGLCDLDDPVTDSSDPFGSVGVGEPCSLNAVIFFRSIP